MRILHVVHRIYPPCFGGLSLYADKICQLLAGRGHRVEAWTTLEDARPREEARLGYVVRRYSAAFALFENPFTFSMLPDLLRFSRFDLVVAHSHLMFTSGFATMKSLQSDVPLVLISHGYAVRRGPIFGGLQKAYISSIGRAVACQATSVIAMTETEATRLLNLGVRSDRCVVIPPGIDSTLFHPVEKVLDAKRIVWIGRFVPEKNLACLIEAAALLKKEVPDIELVLAGEGPERAKLTKLSRNLHLKVKFPGVLARDQIIDLLQNAMIFVLPSIAEAFPLALLEAMACGTPCVASAGLGLEGIVDGAGFIADPGIPQEWAEKLKTMMTNYDLRRSMSRRARELAVAKYDWNIVADKLEKVFLTVVDGCSDMTSRL